MRPFKHAEVKLANQGDSSTPKTQSVLSLALTRLQTANGEIPVVAQAFYNAIVLSYWKCDQSFNPPRWTWAQVQRDHVGNPYFPEEVQRKEQSPAQASRLHWSQALGLAAYQGKVFLAYKRKTQEQGAKFYLERLAWDETGQTLRSENLFVVPLGRWGIIRAGYYHWLGVSGGRLVLALQAWTVDQGQEKPALAVLTTSGQIETADLSLGAEWRTALMADNGGWDFDARLENDKLHVVYRDAEYALRVRADIARGSDFGLATQTYSPVSVDISSTDIFNAPYEPNKYVRIDIPSNQVEASSKDLPGGEHPQIQSLNPLCLTLDRVHEGAITVTNEMRCDPKKWWQRTRWFIVRKLIRSYEKILAQDQGGHWALGRLKLTSAPLVPRNRTRVNAYQKCVLLEKVTGAEDYWIRMSTLDRFDPVWKVRQGPADGLDVRSEAIDFLEHDARTGTVLLNRYRILSGVNLMPLPMGYTVLDINHGSIPPPLSFDPNTSLENTQFEPWQVRRPHDEDRPRRQIVRGINVGHLEEDQREIDNTLGGCLLAGQGPSPMQFYAYTDLGDGQCRVVFDPDILPPEPIRIDTGKDYLSSHWAGPQSSDVQSVELTHGLEWDPITMKRYQIRSTDEAPLSGLDSSLDAVLFFTLAQGQTSVNLYRDTMLELEEQLDAAASVYPAEVEAAAPAANQPLAKFKYSPVTPFPGSFLTFDARGSLSGLEAAGDTALTYDWLFNDGLHLQGEEVSRSFVSFDLFGMERTVTLTVTNSQDATSAATATIRFQPSLWDELWRLHAELNRQSDLFALGDCQVDFSKYQLSYFINPDGARDRVMVRVKDQWDAQRLFVGDAHQQGGVDLRLPLQFQSTDVDVLKWADALVTCNKFKVNLAYIRRFTPGVLMSELRHNHPLRNQFSQQPQQLLEHRSAGLACKPQEATRVEFEKAEVSLSFNWGGNLIGAAIDLLLALGLGWVVLEITSTLAAIGAASVIPVIGWGIAAGLWAGLVFFIHNEVPKNISGQVQGMIENSIQSADFKANLDNAGLLVNAGEGLAESIAVSALTQINGAEPEATGINRKTNNLWEMIYVTSQKCRVYYRKPEDV